MVAAAAVTIVIAVSRLPVRAADRPDPQIGRAHV